VAAEEGAGDLPHRGLARGAAGARPAGVQPAALRRHDAGPRPALCRRLPDGQGPQGRLLVRLHRAPLAAAGKETQAPDGQTIWRIEGNPGVEPDEADSASWSSPSSRPSSLPPGRSRCRRRSPPPCAGSSPRASSQRRRGCHQRAGGLAALRRRRAPVPPRPPDPQPAPGPARSAAARRADAGRRYLDRAAGELDAGERESLLGEALAILAEPSLEALFAPGSLAEVPLAAVLGEEESASASPARSTGWR
jgi:hypothetical protein